MPGCSLVLTLAVQGEKLRGKGQEIKIKTDSNWRAVKEKGEGGEQYQELGELASEQKQGLSKLLSGLKRKHEKQRQQQEAEAG